MRFILIINIIGGANLFYVISLSMVKGIGNGAFGVLSQVDVVM